MNVVATLEREASYAYDKNGNVTEVGTTTIYTYDFDNRLTQSNIWNGTATTTTTYAYDPFGNRISQTASTTTTLYPSKYYSITATTSGTSTVATSTDYLYPGGSLLGTVDQKMVNGTATGTAITRYNHPDNLGSTNVTSDANGNLAEWLDYAPYGSVLASENTGTTTAARQFIGQYSDASGLDYFQNRYYNSSQGQFISEDPAFLTLGNPTQLQQLTQQQQNQLLMDPQQMNAYSYGRDNPITQKDPTGNGEISAIAEIIYYALYGKSAFDTAQSEQTYSQDQQSGASSHTLADDQSQRNYNVLTLAGSTAGLFIDPVLAGLVDGGNLVISAESSYCGSHTCKTLAYSQPISPANIATAMPSPNIELTSSGPQIAAYGNGSPYVNINTSNNSSARAASGPSGNSGGGGSSSTLISLYQSLVSTLTALVGALSSGLN
jgi:RHS repeat-associated protein